VDQAGNTFSTCTWAVTNLPTTRSSESTERNFTGYSATFPQCSAPAGIQKAELHTQSALTLAMYLPHIRILGATSIATTTTY
jgi:hypothetical protein